MSGCVLPTPRVTVCPLHLNNKTIELKLMVLVIATWWRGVDSLGSEGLWLGEAGNTTHKWYGAVCGALIIQNSSIASAKAIGRPTRRGVASTVSLPAN